MTQEHTMYKSRIDSYGRTQVASSWSFHGPVDPPLWIECRCGKEHHIETEDVSFIGDDCYCDEALKDLVDDDEDVVYSVLKDPFQIVHKQYINEFGNWIENND